MRESLFLQRQEISAISNTWDSPHAQKTPSDPRGSSSLAGLSSSRSSFDAGDSEERADECLHLEGGYAIAASRYHEELHSFFQPRKTIQGVI